MNKSSKSFLNLLNNSPMIIAKGQANYESLSNFDHPNLFFLLKIKCPVIAGDIGEKVGEYVIKRNI